MTALRKFWISVVAVIFAALFMLLGTMIMSVLHGEQPRELLDPLDCIERPVCIGFDETPPAYLVRI